MRVSAATALAPVDTQTPHNTCKLSEWARMFCGRLFAIWVDGVLACESGNFCKVVQLVSGVAPWPQIYQEKKEKKGFVCIVEYFFVYRWLLCTAIVHNALTHTHAPSRRSK